MSWRPCNTRARDCVDTIHAAQAYAILMTALGSLIITFIALAANTANHCVWINGVCFDRPQGGYV